MYNYLLLTGTETVNKVAQAIDGISFDGVFNEYLAVMPTMLGVAITFIGIKKAVSLVLGTLRSC